MVPKIEKIAYNEKKVENFDWLMTEGDKPVAQVKEEVPEALQCAICRELLRDAVMMPCCAVSACEDCARTGMIESGGEEPRCPVCGAAAIPEELIPSRMCREKVGDDDEMSFYQWFTFVSSI